MKVSGPQETELALECDFQVGGCLTRLREAAILPDTYRQTERWAKWGDRWICSKQKNKANPQKKTLNMLTDLGRKRTEKGP